jgi:hypothetical protein
VFVEIRMKISEITFRSATSSQPIKEIYKQLIAISFSSEIKKKKVRDFIDSKKLRFFIQHVHKADKLIAAVCHGPVGLMHCNKEGGVPLVKGWKVKESVIKLLS